MGYIGLAMRSFWSDPYLWIHLAGLAALPLFLELCLIGFSIGDPFLPVWLELLLVAAIGIVPIFWMQWQRPFYIFSLVAVALKPEQLTEDQRRLLTLFKSQRNQILAAVVPVALLFVLVKLYGMAAIVTSAMPFPIQWRGAGLLLAAVAFLGSNLFAQVPISVLSVMLNSESTFSTTNPYPLEQIRQGFSLFGLQVNQILPPLISEVKPVPVAVPSVAAAEVSANVKEEAAFSTLAEVDTDPNPEREAPLGSPVSIEETISPQIQPEQAAAVPEVSADLTPPDSKSESSVEGEVPSEEDIWEE